METQGSPGSRVDPVDFVKNVAFNIVKENTTSGLLKALSNMYEKPSAMNTVYLMRKLFNLQMSENGSVFDHINEFNMIVSQLNSVDINFEDEIKVLILMLFLPESWDTVVAAISSSRGSEKLKFYEIRDFFFLAKVFANEKWEIHRAVLSALIEGGEVKRKSKINMVDQNQRIEEYP